MEPGGPARQAEVGRPEDFVQSVGRAVRVLEVVGQHPGLPVKAIARHCSLNISTSYHLVRTLAYEGYLVRLPNGTYVIGEAVARRFHDLVTTLERPPQAAEVVRHLSERVGLSAYLGVLKDERVTVVEVAEQAGSPYLEDFEVGLDVSAHATALGKALLVGMTPKERHGFLLSHELRPFTPRTHTEPAALEAELGAVCTHATSDRARRVPRWRVLHCRLGVPARRRRPRVGCGRRGRRRGRPRPRVGGGHPGRGGPRRRRW